ncbi:N-acetylglutamate synthase [Sinorhizobium sojae CCBAU 05684]|uniref:N-acetylglutamate synthase n=1 Tax=Sinorhizobium sojae CCBAU 05684 TaxID=716928 RepID=A0A249P9Q9_9HYPH|nr:GNAT family N-acetyltransferase [Sinorhizobium sojae]ASY62437.1 N-acetylglutamate synthase [Sinorhizobium sojae CCBAU 05684]
MVVIRHARQNEIHLLSAIGLSAWEKATAGIGDVAAMRDPAKRAFDDFLARHWLSVLLVEDDNRICGWAAREELDGTISDLWIDPKTQGRGLGSALLADIERRIAADAFEVASAKTHAQNTAAVAFFERAGYRVKWLSTAYSQRLDRDVEFIGLAKPLVQHECVEEE